MSMLLPSNQEKFQVISDLFHEAIDTQELTYDDPRVDAIAQQAITSCMPELPRLIGERISVEASSALAETDESTQQRLVMDGVHVEAAFRGIRIEEQHETTTIDESEFAISYPDLYLYFTQRFYDPEPADIIFDKALRVPLSSVTTFTPNE